MENLLQKQGLKRTKLRIALLNCFLQTNHAQSYLDIKKQLGEKVDKSTLYRNLAAFEEVGLIHRINDQSGMAKYAFGALHDHGNAHAHFVCESCETVYCIDDAIATKIAVPEGFKTKNIQAIVKGTCAAC